MVGWALKVAEIAFSSVYNYSVPYVLMFNSESQNKFK